MAKILFTPFSVVGGLLAGLIASKLFDFVWGIFDKQEPPDPKTRDTTWAKMLTALAIEGAIFKAIRGVADRGARRSFYRATGVWPGEEKPDEAAAA